MAMLCTQRRIECACWPSLSAKKTDVKHRKRGLRSLGLGERLAG